MSKQGRYRCCHCGSYFNDAEYEEILDAGWDCPQPDTCEDCCDTLNHPDHSLYPSDADPGL